MNLSRLSQWIATSLAVWCVGCGGATSAPQTKTFEVVLRATSDEGAAVAGAVFRQGGVALGTTDSNGAVTVTIPAEEGQVLPVNATCPSGYIAPEGAMPLRLAEVRRIDPSAPSTLGIEVTCTRKLRDVLVVVRTGQPNGIAVEINGHSVGDTDANGNLHVAMQLDRDVRALSVGLGTKGRERLRPQNPTRVFELDGQDAILLFQQTFSEERPAPVRRRVSAKHTAAPVKSIPYRIDSGRFHAF